MCSHPYAKRPVRGRLTDCYSVLRERALLQRSKPFQRPRLPSQAASPAAKGWWRRSCPSWDEAVSRQ